MSRRTILSRPRTKLYDANYDIGASYYKPALDRLDRKYSGRPLSPPRRNPTLPEDLLQRHARAFTDDDLPSARRRAEQRITDEHLFDSRGGRAHAGRPLSTAFEDEFDEETSNTLQKVRARRQKAVKIIDDVDMESTCNNLAFNRMIKRTDQLLDTVGLNESTAPYILDGNESTPTRRRVLRMTDSDNGVDSSELTKWTALAKSEKHAVEEVSAAAHRARQSRARLNDLEDEMEALAMRQAAREQRAAHLRAFVAENAEESRAMQSALKSSRVEKKQVSF